MIGGPNQGKKKHQPMGDRNNMPHSDGGTITVCQGCGFHLCSTNWMDLCPRGCGMQVCRVCREDRPHATDEGATCELPAGQEPKVWGLRPYPYATLGPEYVGRPFPPLEKETRKQGLARSTGMNA
jgi:hypothetical protein